MMYGHQWAILGRGRILDPTVLVRATLVRDKGVGPATNIASDHTFSRRAGSWVSASPGSTPDAHTSTWSSKTSGSWTPFRA